MPAGANPKGPGLLRRRVRELGSAKEIKNIKNKPSLDDMSSEELEELIKEAQMLLSSKQPTGSIGAADKGLSDVLAALGNNRSV
jgi:hypothetical protein